MDAAEEMSMSGLEWKREASVLIISDRWGHSFQGGIPTALRILASFFHSFGISTYCTVLQKTHEEEKEAKTFKVELICPEPRGSLQRTKPDSTWLLSHEAHFQNLKTRARNIAVVLGFGLTTSEAAMFIKDLEFRNAKYYIANLWPLDEILEIPGIIGCDRHELEKRIDMFREELSKAKILISMDQNTFEYCSQMHSIPTCTLVQIMAQPSKRYYDLKPPKLPENDNPTFRILSFLDEHDVDELRSHRVIANAMNLVAEDFKSMNKTPPKWKILGVPEGKDRLIRKKLKPHSHLNVIPMCLPTVQQIEQELQSSHLVLFPESPGMNSLHLLLSVMAIGIPLITKRFSPCHNLIKKLVANKVNIEHMLTSMDPDDTEELRQKIVHMLTNLQCRVQSALKVKTCLMESAGQLSESCNRSFEKEIKNDIRPGIIGISESETYLTSGDDLSSLELPKINLEEPKVYHHVGIRGKRGAGYFGDDDEEHKVGVLGKRGAGHFGNVDEERTGLQKLRVTIKGGIPKKGLKMACVERAYHKLDEVQKAVPEQLNSSHPDLIVEGVSTNSVIYTIHCKTLDALEFLWQQYESLELKTLITSVTITEGTLKKIDALYLEIQTALDIEEYDKCKMELLKQGQISTAQSPAPKEDESVLPEMVIARAEKLQSECEKLRRDNAEKDAEIRALKSRMEKIEDEEEKFAGVKS